MKTLAAITIAAVAAFSLSACETYDHHDRAGVSVGFVDGYYDDAYGPYDEGYWGDDGVFMYRGSDHQWHHDDAHHFRKDQATGFHTFHSQDGHADHDRDQPHG